MKTVLSAFLLPFVLGLVQANPAPITDFQVAPGNGHGIAQVNESEVSEFLEQAFELLNFDDESLPSLRNLQVALYRNNITRLYEIPQSRQSITELLRGIPLNPVSLALLEEGLGVKLPELDSSLITGFGYNFQTDTILPLSPFNLTRKKLSPIGFIIPTVYQVEVLNEMKEIFVLYRKAEEYYSSRFSFKESSSDSLTIHKSCWWFFCWTTGSTRHIGYNSEKQSSLAGTNTTVEELSSSQEQRLFQLKLVPELSIQDLNTHFVERVRGLTPFSPRPCTSQESWKHFFDSYGTHVVSAAYGGGALNIVLRGSHLYEILKTSVETQGSQVTIMNLFHASNSETLKTENQTEVLISNVYKSVQFVAGDSRFQKPDMYNIEDQEEKNRIVEEWKNSVPQNPVILESNLELSSLMDYIQVVDPTLRNTLNYQTAVNYWLSGSLRTCEWIASDPRPVTIWYDENSENGLPWNHPVRKLSSGGTVEGIPIPISQLRINDYFLCNEDEKCRAHGVPEEACTECEGKWFHLSYESERSGSSIDKV